MKRLIPLLCLLFGLTSQAQNIPQIEQFTLTNGMTVIVKPDRRAPTAVHMLWLRVGAMDEVDGTTGVAHVLEHMMFKGTKTLKPGEFSRRVAALGGRENAFTSQDYTGYYQQIPSDRLADVMQLEADRFANNQWSDEEFRKELEVVKEERRMRTEDNPRAQLYEALNAMAFMAAPYRRPVVGWMSDLDAMTPADARAFYQRWYVPANAVVVVAGDVDVAQVRALAEKYYGAIPARAVPERKPRTEPIQAGLRQVDFKAPAEQAYVTLAFKVPGLTSLDQPQPTDRDALALTVLSAVLDGYRGARLDRALTQGPDRVADSAGASNGLMGRGPQLFTLDGVPARGKTAEQVAAALRVQVARIAREGVSEAELNRVKTQWVASEVYKLDSVFSQARELGSNWVQGLPLDASERLIALLREVSARQVQDVAARYFGDDQLTVAILRPQPQNSPREPRKPATGTRH
ncbi:MAG: insulinase family protein [Gammaproteobacteria bacterium]|nr:insulinase family protein [Gammaproteobacteria bacterium]MBU0787678.1 insulinase family protein [Gammaproteobacteria bacterium]MBU0814852.1 insulinase family protein [Gammaproteobacteria bacterium]MBU1786040.1 insulinase family protein [Gammaproteobacteria bacterium]